MRIIIKPDGSMEFPEGIPSGMLFKFHSVSPTNPNMMIPKYPCTHREGKCCMSSCGKRPILKFWCKTFKKHLPLYDCSKCNARQE